MGPQCAASGPTARDEEEKHEDGEVHDGIEVQRQARGVLAQVERRKLNLNAKFKSSYNFESSAETKRVQPRVELG